MPSLSLMTREEIGLPTKSGRAPPPAAGGAGGCCGGGLSRRGVRDWRVRRKGRIWEPRGSRLWVEHRHRRRRWCRERGGSRESRRYGGHGSEERIHQFLVSGSIKDATI